MGLQTRLILLVSCAVVAAFFPAAAQQREPSDLDAFMSRVIARRDDNWKRMQQYVLDERETFQLLGPGGVPFYGFGATALMLDVDVAWPEHGTPRAHGSFGVTF